VIVDLAIEDDPGATIPDCHRLQASIHEIKYGQPSVPQGNLNRIIEAVLCYLLDENLIGPIAIKPSEQKAFSIWPPVRLHVVHPL
jgi:hypothetical protein